MITTGDGQTKEAIDSQPEIDALRSPRTRRADWVIAFVAALILTDVGDTSFAAVFGPWAELSPGLPIARTLLPGVVGATVLLLATDWREALAQARAVWPLWPGLALALLSALWSEQPGTTLIWASALLAVSAFGVALSARFSPAGQVGLVAALVASVAVASCLVALLQPEFALTTRGWRGVYSDKNLLGRVMALGATAAAVCTLGRRARAAALAALCLCVGLVVASDSRAAMLAAAGGVGTAVLLSAARARRQHAGAILAGGIAVATVVLAFLLISKPGLAVLGRNARFSNRTTIWRAVLATSRDHVWLGRGYAAFWPGPGGAQAIATTRMRALYGNAHNGAVDLYADLGIAGLLLVLVPMAWVGWRAMHHALDSPWPVCVWPAAYLVFFVASNAAESAFVRHKIYWALYAAAACHVTRRHRPPTASTSPPRQEMVRTGIEPAPGEDRSTAEHAGHPNGSTASDASGRPRVRPGISRKRP